MSAQEVSGQDEDARDEQLISQAVRGDPIDPLGDITARPLEPGEKADDAIDFEDIGDDDLAEDEEDGTKEASEQPATAFANISAGDNQDEFESFEGDGSLLDSSIDDLFRDVPTSPMESSHTPKFPQANMNFDFEDDEALGQPIGSVKDVASPSPAAQGGHRGQSQTDLHEELGLVDLEDPALEELTLQQRLFAQSRALFNDFLLLPPPPENRAELLRSLWPKFQEETVPRFMELFPSKRARYVGKTPLKGPKPVLPTKISLEIAPDQEKSFLYSTSGSKRTFDSAEQQSWIVIEDPGLAHDGNGDDEDLDSVSDEALGGTSWQDFQVACTDWELPILVTPPTSSPENLAVVGDSDALEHDDLFLENGRPSPKRQKLESTPSDILGTPQFSFPAYRDPELATATIAKRVILDLNDPNLLVDSNPLDLQRKAGRLKDPRSSRGSQGLPSKELSRKYNISNDEAYEKLKQNHQNRVRSTLGNVTVSHSLPAMRLQWPYYKTKLAKSEARSFHRPMARFRDYEPITFQIPKRVKRKHIKGKDVQAVFNKTEHLSLSDNSNVLLLEYSEEYPTMLSNFGMGSRLINYYRKKHQDDAERPKLDIGELAVLLPNDTSPLTQFGEIKPGSTTPAIYNGMYKAPIYQQEPRNTDFLMIRNGIGVHGSSWYIRTIEHMRVVGQQFPSVEVPPPGGRRVTTASKNRLKMISYRLIRKRKPHRIAVSEITEHIAESNDMQNRQKMKDFMVFSKEYKEWEMRPGEKIPDEEAIRGLVSPEDVCLLESMQVGQQHLEDSGLGDVVDDINEDFDEAREGQNIEQQLAPWQTSKNFLNAAANKAMLQLHGEGDPSGRGEAFSFLKTSMKGGFRAIGESVEDRLDAKKLKELGGHSYNVQKQAESYRESIRRIWEAQNQSLSSNIEHSDEDFDPDEAEDYSRQTGRGVTPRSELQTPSILRRRDNETTSQASRFSSTDYGRGLALHIRRRKRDKSKKVVEDDDIVRDPRVIKRYLALRKKRAADSIDIHNLKDGDDKELTAEKLRSELGRLEKNRERRIARENQKQRNATSPGSPGSSAPGHGAKGGGTQRKCANCGQIGHIKTNKKLCPLLNGTVKQDEGFAESGFSMANPTA